MNLAYRTPARNINGDKPNDTRVNYQLATKAMVIPQISELIFITLIPIIMEVRPFIILQSTDNLAAKVPALFSGISKKGIGILSSFRYVSLRSFNVSLSATTEKK